MVQEGPDGRETPFTERTRRETASGGSGLLISGERRPAQLQAIRPARDEASNSIGAMVDRGPCRVESITAFQTIVFGEQPMKTVVFGEQPPKTVVFVVRRTIRR